MSNEVYSSQSRQAPCPDIASAERECGFASNCSVSKGAAPTRPGGDALQSRDFEQSILPHLDAAYALARWLVNDATSAEDIVQDSCLRAFLSLRQCAGQSAKPWFLKIVRNTAYSHVERRHRHWKNTLPLEQENSEWDTDGEVVDIPSTEPSAEASLIVKDEAKALQEAIGKLPTVLREVLVLRELEEFSYAEMSATLEVPIGTVMSRLSRARAKLMDLFRA